MVGTGTDRSRKSGRVGFPMGVATGRVHIRGWLDRVQEIVERRQDASSPTPCLEAGDSPMMKLGEAANRLSRLGVLAPEGVEWALAVGNRNFIIHQYDEINHALTWQTFSADLPQWKASCRHRLTLTRSPTDSTRVYLVSTFSPSGSVLAGYPEVGREGGSLTTPSESVASGPKP